MTQFRRTVFVLTVPPTLSILLLRTLLLMLLTGQGVVKDDNPALKPSKASSEQQIAIILVDDFEPQPLQGKLFWPHNRLGGDREQINVGGGNVIWGQGRVTATITAATPTGVGVWTALNHPIADHNTINFSAIFPPKIKPGFQGQITGLQIEVVTGTGTFQVELKVQNPHPPPDEIVRWQETVPLSGTPLTLHFSLPITLGEIQNLNWLVAGTNGDFVVVDRVVFTATLPQLDSPERAFLWSYSMLLNNWDPDSGLTRDHAYWAANKFDNVSASGMQAAAAVAALHQGLISQDSATEIVTKTTQALLALPRCYGLWPHFTEEIISGMEIISGTEWSSIDTTIAAVALIEAREALDLDEEETEEIEQVLMGIYTSTLTQTLILTDGSISHGYTTNTPQCAQLRVSGQKTGFCECSKRIEGGWRDFGTESWLVNLGYAAATSNTAVFTHTPPTFNGSGFIDELAWLLVPPPDLDQWGTTWRDYRQQAADCQLAYYQGQTPGCLYSHVYTSYNSSGLFGLSAAEVPDLSAVPMTQTYQPFGVRRVIQPNDGTELLGYAVIVPHYAGMIASLRPIQASALWEWIEEEGLFTPLDNVESFGCADKDKSNCEQLVWNSLKGSWNLSLQTLGWGRYLAEQRCQVPILWQGMQSSPFLQKGYNILADAPSMFICQSYLPIILKQ